MAVVGVLADHRMGDVGLAHVVHELVARHLEAHQLPHVPRRLTWVGVGVRVRVRVRVGVRVRVRVRVRVS